MVAMPLLDGIFSAEDCADRSSRIAIKLIQCALGHLHQIEQLDESLAPADPAEFDRDTVALIYGMYEEWVRAAEALLDRTNPLERRLGPLEGADTLRHACGRTRAMLMVPVERLERDHYLADKPGTPIEEVRRELRTRIH
jgi:hypothetical protein